MSVTSQFFFIFFFIFTSQFLKKICGILLKFSFNSLELSHSYKAPWTSESQWGSCKEDPAKGQVRNVWVSKYPTPCCSSSRGGRLVFHDSSTATARSCTERERKLCLLLAETVLWDCQLEYNKIQWSTSKRESGDLWLFSLLGNRCKEFRTGQQQILNTASTRLS